MIAAPALRFRPIELPADAGLVVANQRDACAATFGDDSRFQGAAAYLAWLRRQIDEYPDGCVLAFLGDPPGPDGSARPPRLVGHLELQVPYGLDVGYVNLFYVAEPYRGRGFGRRLHDYAERYFRAWEARRIELHVSADNERALGFYRRMGYRLVRADDTGRHLWKMAKAL